MTDEQKMKSDKVFLEWQNETQHSRILDNWELYGIAWADTYPVSTWVCFRRHSSDDHSFLRAEISCLNG